MKPKWKETEFWVLVAGTVATVLAFALDYVDGNVAVIVAAIQQAAYAAYRQLSKRKPSDEQLRNTVFSAILESERYRRYRGDGGSLPGGVHPNPGAGGGKPESGGAG